MKTCLNTNCNNPVFSHGYCRFHQYKRTDKKYSMKSTKKKTVSKIRRRSKKMDAAMKEYNRLRVVFLTENPACGVCGGIASQIHHKKGRIGKNLLDQKTWLSVCPDCHRWIEEHPEVAKELGYSENRLTKRA